MRFQYTFIYWKTILYIKGLVPCRTCQPHHMVGRSQLTTSLGTRLAVFTGLFTARWRITLAKRKYIGGSQWFVTVRLNIWVQLSAAYYGMDISVFHQLSHQSRTPDEGSFICKEVNWCQAVLGQVYTISGVLDFISSIKLVILAMITVTLFSKFSTQSFNRCSRNWILPSSPLYSVVSLVKYTELRMYLYTEYRGVHEYIYKCMYMDYNRECTNWSMGIEGLYME